MKMIIMNRTKATPAMFATQEEASVAVANIMTGSRAVRECRVTNTLVLNDYVEEVFGEEYYAVYEPYTGEWYVHEAAPYDTAVCDWCSVGGKFCEYCTKYGEDPYENCGTAIDFELFLDWLDKGGVQ